MYTTNKPSSVDESTTSAFWKIILGLVLISPTFLYGLNLSYATVALPQMNLSISEASWFASVAIYASPFSTIIVGCLIDRFGRKTALMYSIVPSIVGWSLLYWNRNVLVILLGQISNGLTMGAGFYPVQVYAGECVMVDSVRLRNVFMTWISVSSSLGTMCMLLMANLFHYRQICAIAATLCVLLLITFWFVIPESPTWLYRRGRVGDAEWAQKKLGITQPILLKAEAASPSAQRRRRPSSAAANVERKFAAYAGSAIVRQLRILTRPDVYKPTLILGISAALLSFCGTTTVVSYMINIIDDTVPGVSTNESATSSYAPNDDGVSAATGDHFELPRSYRYSLISGAVMCAGSLVSMFVLPVTGMKKMFIASKCLIIVGLVTLTASTTVPSVQNATVRTVAVSLLAFLMGLEVGPRMSFAGDVFPVDAKGFASVPALTGSVATATANKIFPYLRVVYGGYAFLFYAAASVCGIIYIYFLLPEVVGRTLDEINEEFLEKDDD